MLKLLHTMYIHVAANLAMQKLFYTFIPYKFYMNGSREHRPNGEKTFFPFYLMKIIL